MANKVLLKKSSVAAKVPLPSDLSYGELAVNYADAKLYFKDTVNAIQYFVSTGSTDTLTNKTLTSPTINGGALSGTFTGAITLSDTTASTSTTTGALKIGGGLGVAGAIYADQIRLTNNGAGTNVYIGDDVVLGDINVANTLGIRGIQDSTKGYIVFGSSNNTAYIGRDGTNPITATGQFKIDSGTVTGGSAIALQITGYANKGGTGYHDFLSVTNAYPTATNPNKFFRLNSTGNLEIINSAYTTNIFTITDAGAVTFGGTTFPTTNGTNGYVLTSNGTGGSSWTAVAGGGSMTYPGAGIPNSTGTAWGTSYTTTGSGTIVALATSPAFTTSITTGSASFDLLNTTATTVNFAGAGTTVSIGASTGTTTINNNVTVTGNLTVNGTTTTLNATTITVDDINIELGSVTTPTDTTANGGGITLKGTTDKTIVWDSANSNWTSNQDWNIPTGKAFKINNTSVLNATTLGSAVVTSSLTTVGTIGTGTWQGTVVGPTYGGTGVNNGTKTITLGGNLTTSGAFTTTLTATANTSVTLPTTGTLATTGNLSQFAATTSAQLAGVISDETGSGALVFGTNPTLSVAYDSVTINGLANTTIVAPSYSNSIFHSPMSAQIWHDLVAFGTVWGLPTYETYNGTAWSSATLNKNLFAQKEDQSVQILNGTTILAARWTWVNAAYSAARWLQIGQAWTTPTPNKTILVESSADSGATWRTLHTSTYSNIAESIFHKLDDLYGDDRLRVTVTWNSGGTVNFSNLRILSSRPGDQGRGSEYEYPYTWDADKLVNFSAIPTVSSVQVATISATQTLTNKTISGSSNTLSNIGNSSLTNSSVTIGSTAVSLGGTVTTIAGLTSVTSTTFVGALTGNASSATILATTRAIYGNNFDGSAALTQVIAGTYGGTGVNNGSNTITVAGNVSHAGAFTQTFTATGNTSVTLPTSGTLATTGNLSQFAATTSAQLAGVISDETGSGSLVFGTSPTFTTSIDAGATFTAFASPTTVTEYAAATSLTIGGTASAQTISIGASSTSASTYNFGTGATTTGLTKTVNLGTAGAAGSTTNVNIGSTSGGTTTVNNNLVVTGTFTVNGNTETINATTITVDDKNIELGSVASPTDATADGGGITLKGATDKTIIWDQTNTNWTSSENWNLATGKTFKINNIGVLSSTQVLGKTIGGTSAGDIVSIDGTQTLTNKTLSSAVITGTVTAGGSVGTAGYVLSSTGTGVQWIAQSGGGGSTVLYTSQSLSTAQQDQARSNIYAASPDDAIIYSMIF